MTISSLWQLRSAQSLLATMAWVKSMHQLNCKPPTITHIPPSNGWTVKPNLLDVYIVLSTKFHFATMLWGLRQDVLLRRGLYALTYRLDIVVWSLAIQEERVDFGL